ncbi:MAG TPA: hypothetical protein VGC66_22270 [Pyrinomonadaceae bacterium]|jgi:hypothetical protein
MNKNRAFDSIESVTPFLFILHPSSLLLCGIVFANQRRSDHAPRV